MGKRRSEQPAEGAGGEFHVPKTKRSLGGHSGDGSDVTRDTKATAAMGQTDECGQTTGSSTSSTTGESAAPGAAQPESPQRVDSVREEEEGSVDEVAEDAPGRHGGTGDAETQPHRRTGDGPECPGEAAGAAMALPGDTGAAGAHRQEEGAHGELGNTDQNQEPPGVVNAEGGECGAAAERAAGGETRASGAEQPRATRMNGAESCGSAERLGVCATDTDTAGGAAGAESTGRAAGEAAAGREESGAGGSPSPGAGSVPDPAAAAGGSPMGDGESAVESTAGMDTQLLLCCEGTAEMAPAVTVTLVPTGTAEPTGVGTGTAEPTGLVTSTAEPTGTTDPHGVGTGTTEPPSTTEPPGMGTSTIESPGTAKAPGVGNSTTEPPGTAEPPSVGTSTTVGAETPCESRVTVEPPPLQSELPPQQPPPATERHDPAEPAPPGRSHNQEPPHREDATDVICGLILELSNLNRLAMSAHRGLETLRRPKPRQSRRPVPAHARRRWRET